MNVRRGVVVLVPLWCMAMTRAEGSRVVVSDQVGDTSGAAISNATVEVFKDAIGVHPTTETISEGMYSVPNLPPGTYRIQVSKKGFKTIVHPDTVLHVRDTGAIGFTQPIGANSESVTVEGGALFIDTVPPLANTLAVSLIRGGWLSMLRRFVFDVSEAIPLIMLLILEVCALMWFLDKLRRLIRKP